MIRVVNNAYDCVADVPGARFGTIEIHYPRVVDARCEVGYAGAIALAA